MVVLDGNFALGCGPGTGGGGGGYENNFHQKHILLGFVIIAVVYEERREIELHVRMFNPLKTKRRPLYLKPQSVPRCKHFSSRL